MLYHGTSSKNLFSILNNGISPRNENSSTWEDYKSRKDCVYLTTAYALYFAINACKNGEKAVIIEIDESLLDKENMYPDEDFISQILQQQEKDLPLNLIHQYVLNNIDKYKNLWKDSLNGLGNCAYKGIIPIECINRICVIDLNNIHKYWLMYNDPSISILNYKFVGKFKYQNMIKWLFGDIKEYLEFGNIEKQEKLMLFETKHLEMCTHREGIKIVNIKEGKENSSIQELLKQNI